MKRYFFVENLSLWNWIFQILPLAIREKPACIYVIDAKNVVLKLTQRLMAYRNIKLEKLQFRMMDIKDDDGLLLRLRLYWKDIKDVEREIFASSPLLKRSLEYFKDKNRFNTFIKKSVSSSVMVPHSMGLAQALFLIGVVRWKIKQLASANAVTTLFLRKRIGMEALCKYASGDNILVQPLLTGIHFPLKSPALIWFYHNAWFFIWMLRYRAFSKNNTISFKQPKIGIEYYGLLNLEEPEKYSDFFYYQCSALDGRDVAAISYSPTFPIDEAVYKLLTHHQIQPIALHPKASRHPACKPVRPQLHRYSLNGAAPVFRSGYVEPYAPFVKRTWVEYERIRNYWSDAFEANNIKTYISWYKYDATHCAIGDAIKKCGGVMALYQRTLDVTPFIESAMDIDVFFGSSGWIAEMEKEIQSVIPYFVVTGYVGDHRFSILNGKSKALRQKLLQGGAKFIMAFTDENSSPDSRWHTGHDPMRANYEFLLKKVVTQPWFGLVIKPKVPSTLRKRLGVQAELLREAEKTGRCFVCEGGIVHGSYPPAFASLASDVTVHGHLCGATAAFEAALSGVPTLLMDKEGWSVSPLYQLGVGKVVFHDWNTLWDVVLDLRQHGKKTGIGDWSPMLDRLDPFRDGRAAERMGTYLKWMIDDFKTGCDREMVMANAAERYCRQWGEDKIIAIN